MDRKAQQADFIFQMGLLLKPVLDIVQQPQKYTDAERRQVRAQFDVDHQRLQNAISEFCSAEPGAEYSIERHDIQKPLAGINNLVRKLLVQEPARLAAEVESLRQEFFAALAAFPVNVGTTIFDAATPFTAYRRLESHCETTQSRIRYTDRYLDDTLIPRLLQGISPAVHVTIVTWPRPKHKSTKNFDAFMDISRLYAKERPAKYRLVTNPQVHDRWLVCDDQFYHLGGSVKDAADTCVFTVSRMESTSANLQKVYVLINSGTELFGLSNPVHP